MTDWTELGELTKNSGNTGGGIQVSDEWSRRWARRLDDGNWRVVTITAYVVVVNEDETPRVYDVQVAAETLDCTDLDDPGSTEFSSEYEYEYVNYVTLIFQPDAERLAEGHIAQLDPNQPFG